MSSLIGKARKPRFDLHLKIHDLNNVPLVSGHSFIKWHLPHSIHAEHRGRTGKCSIDNHRVEYAHHKIIPSIRMNVDRHNQLSECPIEFEILQEFAAAEKITLGFVRLNLAEYVEESEAMIKDFVSPPLVRRRADSVGTSVSPISRTKSADEPAREPEDGILRRYLIQDSKVNSTLRISILLVQVEGDRNYIAPPLKTAPVFGGIAGFMAPEQAEDDAGQVPNLSKNRDAAEVQDLYRRTLAASWSRQPAELRTDECIEDIFAGGNGWKTKAVGRSSSAPHPSTLDTDDDYFDDADGHHLSHRAPGDLRRSAFHHRRTHSNSSSHLRFLHRRSPSGSSDKSVSTITALSGARMPPRRSPRMYREESREEGRDNDDLTSTSGRSAGSTTPTVASSERDKDKDVKHVKEIGESEVRDDLVCWTLRSGLL